MSVALLHSLGLCFVHLCFPSLSVCVKFASTVRLSVIKGTCVYSVGKVLGKPYGAGPGTVLIWYYQQLS